MHTSIRSLAVLAFTASASAASASVYYVEDFAASATASFSSIGWSAFTGGGATDNSTNTVTSGSAPFVASSAGPDAAAGIGAKGTGGGGIAFVFTNEFSPIATSEVEGFSFSTRNNADQSTNFQRIAVRVGTTWYATNATFGNTAGNTSWTSHEFTFAGDASLWREVTFTAGATLSVSASTLGADLPSGSITAAGLILNNTTGNVMRFDAFTITAIPEPSAFAALAGLAGLGLAGLRRQRRA